MKRTLFLTGFMAVIIFFGIGFSFAAPSKTPEPGRRLLVSFDCTKDYPKTQYLENGQTRVVESPIGRYRETEPTPSARFGYRFSIENVGKPHLAIIRYPDDKRRYMCVMDGTTYDLSTGVFTDYAQPLSNSMQEIRLVFWPRWTDCSITFLTWGKGEPAAVAGFDIYELNSLPPLLTPGDPGDGTHREFGIQYEDPSTCAEGEGAFGLDDWLEHTVSYMKHTGQNLLTYPVVWYHGAIFPSEREPSERGEVVVGKDRKQYVRYTLHPSDWVAAAIERLGKDGIDFQASMTLLRLESLMEKMNIDLDSIKAGRETYNNMLRNDQVQSSPQDWTMTYNARNYPKILEYQAKGLDMGSFPWAYGEKGGSFNPGPMFNPIHPKVRAATVGLVREVAQRYAKYPNFKGVSINLWHATIIWFGTLESGYDDYTVSLFEKETGIAVPVDPKAPDRFSKRYLFLNDHARLAWTEWRCRKIHDLVCEMRDALRSARPDLRLTITLWTETSLLKLIPETVGPLHQLYARPGTLALFREGGFDARLFRDEPGINIDLQMESQRNRGGWQPSGIETPLEQASIFRDHDYLDRDTLDGMHSLGAPGAFMFNSWVESWGNHKWFAAGDDDAQARDLAVMAGKPAEGIFRINSEYPDDGFWWDSQLRITHAFQPGIHFLEQYAHVVAEFDALHITQGGLFLDRAHSDELRKFAGAYRALPNMKFETVGASTDPVVVRTLVKDGKRWLYLVNREYYPVPVTVAFDKTPGVILDAAVSARVTAGKTMRLVLGPYDLRVFTLSSTARVTGFSATPPEDIVAPIYARGCEAVSLMRKAQAGGYAIAGTDRMITDIQSSIKEHRPAWLRRALMGYVVLKNSELARSGVKAQGVK